MDMTYNHMPSWIWQSKELSLTSKVVLERLFPLSKDGEQEIFCARESLKEWLGISLSSASRAFKELIDKGFLEPMQNPNRFSQIRVFKITQKALSNCEDGQDLNEEYLSNCEDASCQIDKGSLSVCYLPLVKMSSSSLDRSKEDLKVDLLGRRKSKMTEDEVKEWLAIPSPIDDSSYEEPTPSEQTCNAKHCIPKEKSSAKKERGTKFVIPSFEEVVALMNEWAVEHVNRYPQLARLDCELEAENFIAYWESNGWKRKGHAIKSLKGTVSTWLINALKYGHISVKAYNPAEDYRRTGLTREMNQAIAENGMNNGGNHFADVMSSYQIGSAPQTKKEDAFALDFKKQFGE